MTPELFCDIPSNTSGVGKRGGIPPLPRNCEREELGFGGAPATESHWFLGRLPSSIDAQVRRPARCQSELVPASMGEPERR